VQRATLGERLLAGGLIDAAQLRLADLERTRFGSLGESLVRLGFLAESDLVRAVCRLTQTPAIDLTAKRIEPEVLALLAPETVHKHRCLPLFVSTGPSRRVLFLGVEDPSDRAALDEVARSTGLEVRPAVVGPVQLTLVLERFYPGAMTEHSGVQPLVSTDTLPLVDAPRSPTPLPPTSVAPEQDERHEVPTRVILQALTKLLTAKGVIERSELLAGIRQLSDD